MSTGLNALLLYPDRPFELGPREGWEYNHETQRRERFVFAEPRDLDQSAVYAKERRLLAEIQSELERGRAVQVYAVYTQKRDVTRPPRVDPRGGRDSGSAAHGGRQARAARGLVRTPTEAGHASMHRPSTFGRAWT